MLTPEFKKDIDEKWDACWPLSLLKPVAFPDLISYLFFLKKISENHPTNKKSISSLNNGSFHSTETVEMERAIINEMEPESMQTLFTAENGSIDIIKNYSRSLAFGAFVKGGLLVTPTQKLLANAVAIMKMIEDEIDEKKGEIFDYLLNKKELNGPNGQAYLPKYLVDLVISIVEPTEKDLILDPSVGDGGLLVAGFKYITGKNRTLKDLDPRKLVGLESDLTSLRIAGMNMMLHGINNPELKTVDTFSGLSSMTIEQPTVIVANLIFTAGDSRMVVEGSSIKEATRKEIIYLKFIIKNAAPGCRIAAIVPDVILYNNATEFVAIRQEIMDRFKVEAVISLNDKSIPQFFGASIIIFYKKAPVISDKVWFYKIEQCEQTGNNEKVSAEDTPSTDTDAIREQRDELEEILNHFKNKDDIAEDKDPDSFYIDSKIIRAKNYSLSYNEYNLLKDQEKAIHLSEATSDEKKEAIKNLKNQTNFPSAEELPEPKKSRIKKVIVISCLSILVLGIGFGAYWFFYLNKGRLLPEKHNRPAAAVINDIAPIVTDTTSDKTPVTQIANIAPVRPDSVVKKTTSQIPNVKEATKKVTTTFTVDSARAYFYRSPDTATRRKVYINNLVRAVLTPVKESNGFIYVNYTNRHGEVTSGWLYKDDLRPLP